jgi:lipopolysaccharide transport system ATP-binding protein
MNDIAIRVENLSKKFRIGAPKNNRNLREVLIDGFKPPFRLVSRLLHGQGAGAAELNRTIWALKDVSFEIRRAEVVGIIGRNGAGKTTLLKILSRITDPTVGRAEIYGRVSSLLEVGTGFHPELTGRDNIYLSGAILGMKKAEIDRKFDEIVAFSEIEKFIDTPVKRYSSGMYVRLAFAVAAHLEPEILLVDEVLAVGDAAFQKKCLGKMGEVTKEGRTILFVSHNMGAIIQLCPSSIVLKQGEVLMKGPSRAVVEQYLADLSSGNTVDLERVQERSGDGRLRFTASYLRNESGKLTDNPISGHAVEIVMEFRANDDLSSVQFMLTIYSRSGIAITHCNVDAYGQRFRVKKGNGSISCRILKLPLPIGSYRVAIAAHDAIGLLDWIPSACIFEVVTSNYFKSSHMPSGQYCTVFIEHQWQLE